MEVVKNKKKPNQNGQQGLPKILEDAITELDSIEVVSLWQIINSISNGNNYVPPSVAKFIAKNTKKFVAANKKSIADEEVLKQKYWEKDSEGRNIYWDGVVTNIVSKDAIEDGVPGTMMDEEKSVFGIKAYLDEKKNVFFDSTGTELPIEKAMKMRMLIPQEKLPEYSEKLKALQEKKNTVHVVKINLDYLEDMRIAVPTAMTVNTGNPQNPKEVKKIPLDLDAFFEYLIIGGDEKPENNN